jgi:hypothetical protein
VSLQNLTGIYKRILKSWSKHFRFILLISLLYTLFIGNFLEILWEIFQC